VKIRLKVKEVIDEKGISMSMLSHKTFLSLTTIRTICNKPYRPISTDTLARLATALDISVFDLLEEIPDEEQKDTSTN
jgi:DNA-binding Xre family transcriptional regulator